MKRSEFSLFLSSFFISSCFGIRGSNSNLENSRIISTQLKRVTAIDFSPDGNLLLLSGQSESGDDETTIEVWHSKNWEIVNRLTGFNDYNIWSSFISKNKDVIISSDLKGQIYLWNFRTNNIKLISDDESSYSPISEYSISQSNDLLAIGDNSNSLWTIDIGTKQKKLLISKDQIFRENSSFSWASLDFSPDEFMLAGAIVSEDFSESRLYIFDLEKQEIIKSIKFDLGISKIGFLNSNGVLIVGLDGHLNIYDINEDELKLTFDSDNEYLNADFDISLDRRILAVGSFRSNGIDAIFGVVNVWNIDTGELLCSLGETVATSNINDAVALSPDGSYLVTTERGDIRLWDIQTCLTN